MILLERHSRGHLGGRQIFFRKAPEKNFFRHAGTAFLSRKSHDSMWLRPPRLTLNLSCEMPGRSARQPGSGFFAHLESIRSHLTIEDYSRVDAMIALRLRSNDHIRESVEETIRVCARPFGKRRPAATGRTAEYAFGPAGSRDLVRNERDRKLWRRVEVLEEKERASRHIRMR